MRSGGKETYKEPFDEITCDMVAQIVGRSRERGDGRALPLEELCVAVEDLKGRCAWSRGRGSEAPDGDAGERADW